MSRSPIEGENDRTDELPAVLADVVEVTCVAGKRITVTSSVNAAAAELLRFGVGKVPAVALGNGGLGGVKLKREGRERSKGESVRVRIHT